MYDDLWLPYDILLKRRRVTKNRKKHSKVISYSYYIDMIELDDSFIIILGCFCASWRLVFSCWFYQLKCYNIYIILFYDIILCIMFPNLYVWNYVLPFTGIWLVLAALLFMFICYIEFRKIWFDFWKLFFAMPYMIWLPYILGRYVDMMLSFHIIIPHNKAQILSILSTFNYNFHYIWVCIGIILAILIFLWSNYKYRRDLMVILFDALMQSMILLGIFWVIGDDFVGRPNDGSFAIWAIAQVSKINNLWKVYPVWIMLSFICIILVIKYYIHQK